FSEAAWMRSRVHVEAEYLVALSGENVIRSLSDQETGFLRGLYRNFSLTDAADVKKIEKERAKSHDIKAIEYWIGDRFADTSLTDLKPKIHFGLTSEDVDNIAITYLFKESVKADYLPSVLEIGENLYSLSDRHKALSMLGRTHGKAAATTTAGKEIAVYVNRVQESAERIAALRNELPGKMNGPVGTYDPMTTTYPDHDWMKFSEKFVSLFGLVPYHATTQLLPHDRISRLFREIVGMNDILEDMSQNFWRYVSDDWFSLVAGQRGISSIMAHKRNPEEFENAEGNLQISSTLLNFMASKLQKSRLQRDLSGSTVRRNYGVAMAHALLGYGNIKEGLNVMNIDEREDSKMLADLYSHPEILSTNMQTILRSVGSEGAYEKLQEMTRGKHVTSEQMAQFVDSLDVDDAVKKRLKSLDIRDSARASDIVDDVLVKTRSTLDRLKTELANA
ncbi:MAG: lyase family protein, partial [Candidatus Aenigmatarchaeota archaeon]